MGYSCGILQIQCSRLGILHVTQHNKNQASSRGRIGINYVRDIIHSMRDCVQCGVPSRKIRCKGCRRNPECLTCHVTVTSQQSLKCKKCNGRPPSNLSCRHCNTPLGFSNGNRKYCNDTCRQKWINIAKLPLRKNAECNMCFKNLTGSRGFKYCGQECYGLYRKLYLMNKRTDKELEL